ncbi:hypothetical protein PoB_002728800 [Plakobranchus ocellatus]|uniref:Uncharacterized protein n=1 Tax=Plakobranchus ocellatus TaxID=259542 RepID=A0AAV4A253_9GAST|nr:hypothetical protein PoB_002728800 [Plakobranchus ocellatus]
MLRLKLFYGLFFQELWTGRASGCVVFVTDYAFGFSGTVTFDITTLATSNTHSSAFLTPVLALAIALPLIAMHTERYVCSDIKSRYHSGRILLGDFWLQRSRRRCLFEFCPHPDAP